MIGAHAGPILLVTGALTATLMVGLVAPRPVLAILLGIRQTEPIVATFARHWLLLVGLVGCLLIYAAGYPETRVPALIAGSAEKLVFVALVLATPVRRRWATAIAATADAIMALLFLVMLAGL